MNPFKEPFSKKYLFNCLKASKEIKDFKILPSDGLRACWQIGLERRHTGRGANCGPLKNFKKKNSSPCWKRKNMSKSRSC